ncbi:Ribonuclease H domain [Macleaya cordata]|uniref:Ribonuclease H domain n=1 Tax=Macleaya cordata TaxID=56857 RepID=A0A200RBT5_MACCD|nr:Ribonuclease H domain [Macleaya cordata]
MSHVSKTQMGIQLSNSTADGKDLVSTVQKLAFNAYIYHVWFERNKCVFTTTHTNENVVINKIFEDIRLKLASHDLTLEDNDRNRQFSARWGLITEFNHTRRISCTWEKPPEGTVMINTDGSLNQTGAGFGAIIRNTEGEVLAAAAGTVSPSTITCHELQAIESGLVLANKLNLRRVTIGSDSQVVCSYFNSPSSKPPWNLIPLWNRIKRLSLNLQSLTVKHIYRETNRAADFLANTHPMVEFIELAPSSFAEDLKKIIFEDKIGCIYILL